MALGKPILGELLDRADPLAGGLLACWPAWEKSGSALYDAVNARVATLVNAPAWIGGDAGPALSFDGSTQYGTTAATTSGALTIAALVRPNGATGFAYAVGESGNYAGFRFPSLNTPSLCDRSLDFASPVALAPDRWALLVGTLDGVNARFYIDGAQVASGTSAALGLNGNLQIVGTSGASLMAPVGIGGVWAWGRALGPAEVADFAADPFRMLRDADLLRAPASAPSGDLAASLASASNLTGTGSLGYAGAAAPASGSTVVATGSLGYAGAAAPASGSTVVATGDPAYHGAATLSGAATAAGTLAAAGATALGSASTLAAAGRLAYAGAATAGAASSLSATGATGVARKACAASPLARLLCLIRARPGSQPAPLPDDLLGAVKARFLATPGLAGAIAGGIYLDERPRNLDAPCVCVQERGARLDRTSDTSQIHDTRLIFKIYGPDPDTAGAHGDILDATFKGRNLEFRQGYSNALVRHNRCHQKEKWWGQGGEDVWFLLVEFQCRVLRTS